jgi:HTH-type transcriptional regulator/antitoxin HigA
MTERVPAEVFPPGDFLREELEERGWTQRDLAQILDRPLRTVNEVVTGKRGITPDTARGLAAALGTSAELWMNLETAYQLHRSAKPDETIAQRARLFAKAPVIAMIQRGWIEPSDNTTVLEKRLCDFFSVTSMDEPLGFPAAARTPSARTSGFTPEQAAWLARATRMAKVLQARTYDPARFTELIEQIRLLLLNPEDTRRAPRVLAEFGIRLVIVKGLPHSKIEGACFWLDEDTPAIALSMRHPRIDYFWYTLMHELGHVRSGDGQALDDDWPPSSQEMKRWPERELRANDFAEDALVPAAEMADFIDRTGPLYSKHRIRNFAQRMNVHPGIVVGQLQFKEEIPWKHNREMLVSVRDYVTDAALTDGWNGAMASN